MKNGKAWYDTDGNVIHCHGGYIIQYDGYYYWYGENRLDNNYVSCYRSKDLKTWEFRNHVLTTDSKVEQLRFNMTTDLFKTDGVGNKIKVNIERPKVLYNKRINQFVMWAHYENGRDYLEAKCAIATCDTPDGDFVFRGAFNPYGYMSRDCTLFEDEDAAYFISASRDNADLHIYRLTEDYLNVDEHVRTLFQGEYREAPALFKKDGMYYMITSFCTGWAPNQGKFSKACAIGGQWTSLKNFGDETTYRSQPAFVLPVSKNGETKYYYFGDRWGGKGKKYFESTYVVLEIKFDENNDPYIIYEDEVPDFI